MAIKVNGITVVNDERKGTFESTNPGQFTTAQRDALTPEIGDTIYNNRRDVHQGELAMAKREQLMKELEGKGLDVDQLLGVTTTQQPVDLGGLEKLTKKQLMEIARTHHFAIPEQVLKGPKRDLAELIARFMDATGS